MKSSAAPGIELTVLGEHCVAFAATLLEHSSQAIRLATDQPVPLNAPVRIDMNDSILLGEVCQVSTEDGRYVTNIRLQHVLQGLTDLHRLVAGIMGESWPRRQTQPKLPPVPVPLKIG
ncbi:MAG TPA: hypothetical protein VMZ52_13980 [Bryobacteraceae bacterium]|nr:hypothetical protein [Bryobacteraceae bacterium]